MFLGVRNLKEIMELRFGVDFIPPTFLASRHPKLHSSWPIPPNTLFPHYIISTLD